MSLFWKMFKHLEKGECTAFRVLYDGEGSSLNWIQCKLPNGQYLEIRTDSGKSEWFLLDQHDRKLGDDVTSIKDFRREFKRMTNQHSTKRVKTS